MRTAKISELKAKLSAHIRYVKNGEEVLILDRNTPVARLVPVKPFEGIGDRESRLIAQGVMSPPIEPRREGDEWPGPAGPNFVARDVMEQVWREERDGR